MIQIQLAISAGLSYLFCPTKGQEWQGHWRVKGDWQGTGTVVQCAVQQCSVQCLLYNIQCAICSVQYVVYSMQCAVYGVQFAGCNMQCLIYSVQCAVCSERCEVHSVHLFWSVLCSVQYAVFNLQCVVCNVQYAVFSVLYSLCSAQCTVHSVLCALSSVKYAVQSTHWHCTPGTVHYLQLILQEALARRDEVYSQDPATWHLSTARPRTSVSYSNIVQMDRYFFFCKESALRSILSSSRDVSLSIWEDICRHNSNQIHVINLYFWRLIVAHWDYSECSGWCRCRNNAYVSHTVSHLYIQCQMIAGTQAQLSVLELGQKL